MKNLKISETQRHDPQSNNKANRLDKSHSQKTAS